MTPKKPIIIAVSGGFDPIHPGHVRMLKEAKGMGDKLIVILNNDNWLVKKKGFAFMPEGERKEIVKSIRYVDDVFLTTHSKHTKDMSVCNELEKYHPDIFANGGDRFLDNIPEVAVCKKIGCKMVFNVGHGGKLESSSWLLSDFLQHKQLKAEAELMQRPEIKRPWGGYTILKKTKSYWVKKLFIYKGSRTSLQSHHLRSEIWFVLNGHGSVQIGKTSHAAKTGDAFFVPPDTIHRLAGKDNTCILEIAYGHPLESDIIRFEDDYGRKT